MPCQRHIQKRVVFGVTAQFDCLLYVVEKSYPVQVVKKILPLFSRKVTVKFFPPDDFFQFGKGGRRKPLYTRFSYNSPNLKYLIYKWSIYHIESPTPSAQYWIGEALYAEKDFKSAIEEFQMILKHYKSNEKAPDAALKLGYSFYELKDWENARKALETAINFFPNNVEITKLAQERLEMMMRKGH